MNWHTSILPIGEKVFIDKNCFTEKVTYRAVAVVVDIRRPNRVKPIYKVKRFVKRKPAAYFIKGIGFVVHPDIYTAMQRLLADSVEENQRKMIYSAFGVQEAVPPSSLSISELKELIKKYTDGMK